MNLYLVVLLLNYEVHEVDTLQHLHLHFFHWFAFEENRSRIGAVSTGTTTTLMSNVVAATHVDEHCGCSPHSLFLGLVGRSEVMHCIVLHHSHLHCIASFTFALHCFASFAFALHCIICICTFNIFMFPWSNWCIYYYVN